MFVLIFRERKGEEEKQLVASYIPTTRDQPGTWPVLWPGCNILVHDMMLNQLSHTSQGRTHILDNSLEKSCINDLYN